MSDHDPSGGSGALPAGDPSLPTAVPSLPEPPRPDPPRPDPPRPASETPTRPVPPPPVGAERVQLAREEAERRARRRGRFTAFAVILMLAGAGAVAFVGYRQSRPDETAITEPTQFTEDFPSVRGGPRAEDQMDEINEAIDDAHGGEYLGPGETLPPGDPGDPLTITNHVIVYESAAPDSEPAGVLTEYHVDSDQLTLWHTRGGNWYDVVASGRWVYRTDGMFETRVARHARAAAGLEPGPDFALAGIVMPDTVLPDEVRPYATTRSEADASVQVWAIDLEAFEATAPDAAAAWLDTWTAPATPERLADTTGPMTTAPPTVEMDQLRSTTLLLAPAKFEIVDIAEPIDVDTFVAYQLGPDGTVVTARLVSRQHDLRVDFLIRDRIRNADAPTIPDVEWG